MVRLLAAILHNGQNKTHCPVCGSKKEDVKKMVCLSCFTSVGDKAVFNQGMAWLTANYGHDHALETGVKREILWGVLGNVKLPKTAEHKTPGKGIEQYFASSIGVKGGLFNLSFFGFTEEDLGKTVTGYIELKEKHVPAGTVAYLRIQKVSGVVSDADLLVGDYNQPEYSSDLPISRLKYTLNKGRREKERFLHFSVGFVPAKAC